MDRNIGTHVRLGVLASAVAVTGALAPAASAQIPGTLPAVDAQTYTVVTGDQRLRVAVSEPNYAGGTVSVTVQNNTGGAITCGGFGGGPGLSVAPAEVISRSMDHYSRYAVYPDPKVTVDPIKVAGIGVDEIVVPLGSVTDMFPAVAARHIWPEGGSRAVIASKFDDARMQGQTGRQDTFTVPANTGVPFTITLNTPATSPRPEFDAAAMVGCTLGGLNYVFAGYSPSTPPQGGVGSLDMPTFGRFGS